MKIECEVCHALGYLQKLGNYYRVRHYQDLGKETGKSRFFYHQQSKEYALRQIALLNSRENFIEETSNIGESETEGGKIEHLTTSSSLNQLNSGSDSSGRRLVWFRTLAFQANDHGFESRRPHSNSSLVLSRQNNIFPTSNTAIVKNVY
jgi:hypothetical protein